MEFAEFIKTPKVDSVVMRRPFCADVEGTLSITGHHLILSSRQDHKEELWLLYTKVDSVEKRLIGSGGTITIKCKDFTLIYLDVPTAEDCLNVATSIEQLSNIDDLTLKYPFFNVASFDILENGWQAYTPEAEMSRYKDCSEEWRLTYVNKDYKLCPSYPHAALVPKVITDEMLIKIAGFRQHGRFPVLSYYHRDSRAVMMRCSQPLTGTSGKRCKEDEKLVNAVLGIGKRGYIVDTRSLSIAKAAQKEGGGYEPEAHYSQWKRLNQPIERRQVFHESLIKLIEACSDTSAPTEKWLSKLESSNWLTHIKDILTCSCLVAQCIDKDASVLVHGADGYDSTLLVTSLVQVILDHDCRTFTGFEALVEREWLQAGHPFGKRCAKSAHAITKNRHESPVFLLFLDCVWQIWQQFPCSFEFSEDFLIVLFEHAYSSEYGTFLCNNEMERKAHKLETRTVSLWSYLNRPEVLSQYLNPMYEPNPAVIWPSVAPQSLEREASSAQSHRHQQATCIINARVQAMYCCAWLCLARCATSMVDEVNCVREQVVPLSRLEYKQWVMNYLHLHKQLQRDKYAKHASKAKNQPSKYLSIILDGMDQNKTAIPHFSRHSKTTQGIWKLKTHLTGAILHGKGILGFFDVGQFKHDSNLNIAILMHILHKLTCFPPVLYLQMDNCWKDNKNRFLIGFLSLLVHLGIFRKVKLGYLMVGHTHEDVDRVFSRFSKTLRFNGAPTLDGLLNLWERSQVPAPTGINLQRTWNVKQWLIPCLDSMERHSKPHCFKMVRNEDGMVEVCWKKWATDKEWINAGALLLMKPGGEPQIVRASYDQILLKRLQEDIVGKAGPFLKDEDKHWWGEFFKSVNEQETDQELPEWALDRLCKTVKETREKEVEEEPVPFETTHSDEDDPIPPELWSGLYQRSQISREKQREAWTEISKIREYDKELRSKVSKLRRQLASLESEAVSAGVILPSSLDVDCNGE